MDIRNPVVSIGLRTFQGCTSLKRISFGTGLTDIDARAFDSHTFYDIDGTTRLDTTAECLKGYLFLGVDTQHMVKQPNDGNIDWYIAGDTLVLSKHTS